MGHHIKKRILCEEFPEKGNFYTLPEAAKQLNISRVKLETLLIDKDIEYYPFGCSDYISEETIKKFKTKTYPMTAYMILHGIKPWLEEK